MDPTEHDPTGRSAHEPGAKLDAGKPRPALVLGGFARALSAVADVGTYGARKYTDNGWRTVPGGIERYSEAMLRHWLSEVKGEQYDLDTKLLHAAHLAWNAQRLELMLSGSDKQDAKTAPAPSHCWLSTRMEPVPEAAAEAPPHPARYEWDPAYREARRIRGNLPAPTTRPPSNVIVAKDVGVRMEPVPEAGQRTNPWRSDRLPTSEDTDNFGLVWMWSYVWHEPRKHHFQSPDVLGRMWAPGNLPAPTTPPVEQ